MLEVYTLLGGLGVGAVGGYMLCAHIHTIAAAAGASVVNAVTKVVAAAPAPAAPAPVAAPAAASVAPATAA